MVVVLRLVEKERIGVEDEVKDRRRPVVVSDCKEKRGNSHEDENRIHSHADRPDPFHEGKEERRLDVVACYAAVGPVSNDLYDHEQAEEDPEEHDGGWVDLSGQYLFEDCRAASSNRSHSGTGRSAQQNQLAGQYAFGRRQSVQVDTACQRLACVIQAVPGDPVVTRLLITLTQDLHPLPGYREDLQAGRTRLPEDVGKNRLAVEGIGRVLVQLDANGQPDRFSRQLQQLGPLRRGERVGKQKEIREIDQAAAIEIIGWVAAAHGIGKEEEVGKTDCSIVIEIHTKRRKCPAF